MDLNPKSVAANVAENNDQITLPDDNITLRLAEAPDHTNIVLYEKLYNRLLLYLSRLSFRSLSITD